jgi:hypothetical protein
MLKLPPTSLRPSGLLPAQRSVTGPAEIMAAIEGDDLPARKQSWVPERAAALLPTAFEDSSLMFSCRLGSLKVMQWLVREGKVDVNLAAADGWTPLCIAVKWGWLEVVKWLVREGKTDVNLAKKWWVNTLVRRCQMRSAGHSEVSCVRGQRRCEQGKI